MTHIRTADVADRDAGARDVRGFLDYGGVSTFQGEVVVIHAGSSDEVREQLASKGEGRVLVVDAAAADGAVVGLRSAHLAHRNGWSGIVVNGLVRDTADLHGLPIGVKALGSTPHRANGNQGNGGRSATIGNTEIIPGNYLYADSDGIIVTSSRTQG